MQYTIYEVLYIIRVGGHLGNAAQNGEPQRSAQNVAQSCAAWARGVGGCGG